MAADISDILNRLAGLQEATTDPKTKEQLLSIIKDVGSFFQEQETERNSLLATLSQHKTTITELQAGGAAQSPVADETAKQVPNAAAEATDAAARSATPFDLANSFKSVIDAIQAEALDSSSSLSTTIKSMDIEIKGLVQVDSDKGTVLVLPSLDSPIDSNSLSTLRVSFGSIPVAAPATLAPTTVTVPDVRQKSLGDAINQLQRAGLAVGSITERPAPGAAAGTVVSQQPGPGTVVAAQTPIGLVVAAADLRIIVPNVVGLALIGATTAITAAGLHLGVLSQQQSASTPNTVLQQNPAAGQQVAAGAAVNLVVATPLAGIGVPNVIGLTLSAATDAIRAAGLQVGLVDRQQSPSAPDTVLTQNPAAGQQVAPGTSVNLVVAMASPRAVVPNVIGLALAAATGAIRAAGLQLGTVDKQRSATVPDTVLQQNPAAGLLVTPGSPVNLTVSSIQVVPVVIVPNVLGLTSSKATGVIIAAGLRVGPIDLQPTSSSPPDIVIDQVPTPKEEVAPETLVILTVSAPDTSILVPDLTGLTLAKATKRITAAGLSIGQVQKQPSNGPAGSVLGQSPIAGSKVTPASVVDIVIDDR